MTVLAVRTIKQCDTVFHSGKRDDAGFAYEIVAGLLEPRQRVRGMSLAMKRGADDGSVGYGRVAEAMAAESRAGRRVVFLTEGDPTLFGTGAQVASALRSCAPELAVEIVPGVTGLSAAAARLGWPLVQKDEILTVCPATYYPDEIGTILDRGGPVCWLKAADVLPRLVEELAARGRLQNAALVERVGCPDERIFLDLTEALAQPLSYFSLVLVR
jgi:precorrin-2/cobalt-factor-2 C20-methyltransferase